MGSYIKLRAPESDDPYEDSNAPMFQENCTVAILDINGIRIPLSIDRVNDLINEVNEFSKIVFCYKCDKFIMSRSGFKYGGSCKLQAEKDGVFFNDALAGYRYAVDCTHTCKDAIPKKET